MGAGQGFTPAKKGGGAEQVSAMLKGGGVGWGWGGPHTVLR